MPQIDKKERTMKRSIATALLVAAVGLQAGFFDSAMEQAGSYMQSSAAPQKAEAPQSNGLISTLTDELGITPKQAAGGTALLMKAAADSMPKSNYTSLLSSVPGLS
jgi:hypothetical protein